MAKKAPRKREVRRESGTGMAYQKTTHRLTAPDGSRIALHRHQGTGERDVPAVILTNGIGTTENFWRFLVQALTPSYHVFHWDYRGHGDSGTSISGDYGMAVQAEDLALVTRAVREATGEAGPLLHIAFSMGVAVLLEHHRRAPEAVKAMVLIAGAPDAPGTGTLLFRAPGVQTLLQKLLLAATPVVPLVAPVVQGALATPLTYPVGRLLGLLRKRAPKEDIAQFMRSLSRMDAKAYWGTLIGLMHAHASDVLPQVRVPVFIIAAKDDLFVPRAQVSALTSALPAARFLEVEDAGHAGLLEAGTQIASAVSDFLASARSSPPVAHVSGL